MRTRNFRFAKGISLIEAMAATVILAIILLGTMNFSYFATRDSHIATMKISAARLGLLLVETWKGVGGSASFDPASSLGTVLTIEDGSGPAKPETYTLLGRYHITLDDAEYYTALSWRDVSADLRALNIAIVSVTGQDAELGEEIAPESSQALFDMTTYVLR